MEREKIIQMAREAGWSVWFEEGEQEFLERFAQLAEERTAAAEQDKWKEIVEGQRQRLQALNEIIGGEDSTTTGNILSYSRWEMRLEDAVTAEREACAQLCEATGPYTVKGKELAAEIRARGQHELKSSI